MRLYYNPRCSKSRAALELLENTGHAVEVVDYLQAPPAASELARLIDALDSAPAALVRTGDASFADSGYTRSALDRDTVIALLVAQPALMQRPVLATDTATVIARPPERVFELVASDQESDS
jgi:arsenate reductase